jgi:penicillin-binding protein 1A
LPAWIDFMKPALARTPAVPFLQPPGMVTVRIDANTGLRAGPDDPNAMFETFRADRIPTAAASADFEGVLGSDAGDLGRSD